MGWRIFSVLNVLIVLWITFAPFASSNRSLIGWVGIAMSVLASGGVFLYVFGKPVGQRFWRAFSFLFAAISLVVVAFFVMRSIQVGTNHRAFVVAALLALIGAYHYFTWLAVHRLGKGLVCASSIARNRGEYFNHLLTEAAIKHPRRVKVVAWSFVVVILAAVPLTVWNVFSEGKAYKLVVPIVMGLVFGFKAYRERALTKR
jgi:hypothetical protein